MKKSDRQRPPHPALALGYSGDLGSMVTEERLCKALSVAAGVVAMKGEEYLPIFQRIEKELQEAQGKSSAHRRALSIASHSKVLDDVL